MSRKRVGLMLTFAAGITTVLIAVSKPVHAAGDVNDFIINKFSADYLIDNKAVGGSLETTETIDLTFSAQNHGILRAIPQSYEGYKTKLKIKNVERDGRKEPYTTYKSNDNLVLKIGNADTTITGTHQYVISYYQERIINFNRQPGSTLFYWDVNGTEWQQPFEAVEMTLRDKNGVIAAESAKCYTGVFGNNARNCMVSQQNQAVHAYAQNLKANESLTIQVPLATQFRQPGLWQKLTDGWASIVGLLTGLAIAVAIFLTWRKYGKDYATRGVIVPEYEAPNNLTPAEVGMLADYKVDTRDISATLIDLAVRGYLKINEDVSKSWGFTRRKYTLELQRPDFTGLRPHEQRLLRALFPQPAVGAISDLSTADKTKLAGAVTKIKTDLRDSLTTTYGLIESQSGFARLFLPGLALAALLAFGCFTQSPGSFAGLAVGVIALIWAALYMQRRSHAGVEAYEKIQGLKLYMNTAEKDRLKMMQSVERPYALPSQTVELFEKLLPFAVALGVEKSWAKQFDSILTDTPAWYGSNSANAFSAGYIASSLGSATQNFSSSFAASSTDSSSSGGGGFSGGGGGGGGGGGW